MISALYRLVYGLVWLIMGPFVLAYACYRQDTKLPKRCFYFDNAEEDFDGAGLGWYDNYLGIKIREQSRLRRYWISIKWSIFRNNCFNLRYHPVAGYDVTEPKNIVFEGNTYHHTKKWSHTKDHKATLRYKMVAEYDGKKATSRFLLLPLFKGYHLYLRWGLKIYPRHYFDEYWLKRIAKEGFPKSKTHGVYALTIRVRKDVAT